MEILLICACIGSFSVGVLIGLWKPWVSDEPFGNQTEVEHGEYFIGNWPNFMIEKTYIPSLWDYTPHEYLAIDNEGKVWAFNKKPVIKENKWMPSEGDESAYNVIDVDPPKDFTKCIWQRPIEK